MRAYLGVITLLIYFSHNYFSLYEQNIFYLLNSKFQMFHLQIINHACRGLYRQLIKLKNF